MTVILPPELQKLVEEKVRNGEFAGPAEVIEIALRNLFSGGDDVRLAAVRPDQWMSAWDEFMAELDRDFPPGTPVLSDEALSRESIYDDDRHRA